MIFIGIDPGTAATGYAVLEIPNSRKGKINLLDVGVISTSKDIEMHRRLGVLYKGLNVVCNEFKPEVMVIEKLFFNTNVKTAMTVGQARGISLLVGAGFDMSVIEYTALQAKLVLTGYGRAEKKEMQEAVKSALNLTQFVKPDDANDAVAMVLCHYSNMLGANPFASYEIGIKNRNDKKTLKPVRIKVKKKL